MARVRDLLKRNIVAAEQGVTIGRPKDVLIDPMHHRVAALVVDHGPVPQVSVVCRAEAIRDFSANILAIDKLESMQLAFRDTEMLDLMEKAIKVRGRTVITSQGKKLGRISVIQIDGQGNVVEYRVRRSGIGWLLPLRRMTPRDLGNIGGDTAVTREGWGQRTTKDDKKVPS